MRSRHSGATVRAAIVRAALVPVTLAVWAPPKPALAQSPPLLTVTSAGLSADTVELGDRFELRLTIELAPGAVAFLPDSVVGPGFEPFGPVEWTVGEGADPAVIAVTYPLIAFQVGTVTVPDFDVFGAGAAESTAAGLSPEGTVVGNFEAFVQDVSFVPSARLRTVPALSLEVASVLTLDDQAAGIAPRPAADVAGGNRAWPATVLIVVCGLTLLTVATVSVRDWVALRSIDPPPLPPNPRSSALAALDRLLAEGGHQAGSMRDFFTSSSEILRRYVESLESRWGPAWTSTELMHDLEHTSRTAPPGSVTSVATESLAREMGEAERVKFAGEQPQPKDAERHVRTLRYWIEASAPEEPGR